MASQVPIMEMASDKLLHSLATPKLGEKAKTRAIRNAVLGQELCRVLCTSRAGVTAVHNVLAHSGQHAL